MLFRLETRVITYQVRTLKFGDVEKHADKLACYIRKKTRCPHLAEDANALFLYRLFDLLSSTTVHEIRTLDRYLWRVAERAMTATLPKKRFNFMGDHDVALMDSRIEPNPLSLADRQKLWTEVMYKLSPPDLEILKAIMSRVPTAEAMDLFDYNTKDAWYKATSRCRERIKQIIDSEDRYEGLRASSDS